MLSDRVNIKKNVALFPSKIESKKAFHKETKD